ncbi:ABC transporter permease [Methylobacterium planeticum]|uniref:ABC transporter permease subunit n=1 Tax=Methylobacterium planeticum TaxID=2615211 RepID=A0A6N6MLY8_9HYPH|nr:ABC transporter permease subunit [Methylobacterium planeticum]KAB1071739.1 ABC transporter permease subunit [Methylobacterium planeticum]
MTSVTAGSLPRASARPAAPPSPWVRWGTVLAALPWLALSVATRRLPETGDFPYSLVFANGTGLLGLLLLTGLPVAHGLGRVGARLRHWAPWIGVLGLAFLAWELVTAKLELLPMPFFPPPQAILEVFLDDWARLGHSTFNSLVLLAGGYAIGAAVGFVLGVAIGWSRAVGYWAHPILRFVGPLPATAWLPLAFFVFPSSWSASTFLVALATGFPVTVLTWSGVAGVNKAYFDVARTLGASGTFLVLRVAVPAALPHVFVGLFMGLGGSFAVLVVAEMLGVKAGLGWYLQWAQGWAAYANMYAALIVMALMCSSLISLLFRLRDRLLAWQKGLVQW